MLREIVDGDVNCAPVMTAVWPWFALTVPFLSLVVGDGDEDGLSSLQLIVIVAALRIARADSSVNSRRVRRLSSDIVHSPSPRRARSSSENVPRASNRID